MKENNKENKPLCLWCNKPFTPCHKTSRFCSKSCATSYRNKQKIEDGTHNFYNIDRSRIAKDNVLKGIHPFLPGNMSEESLKKKAEGISRARKKSALEHTHPWQNPKNYIPNEYSRSLSIAKRRNLTEVILYIAETDFKDTIKIGWTFDISIREHDTRIFSIHNIKEIWKDTPENIILVEKLVKEKFFNEDYFKQYHSTEVFPISLKDDILDFIDHQRLLLKKDVSDNDDMNSKDLN